MSNRDVFEYIVDGTSGLAPGGVDGKAIVTGVCSLGDVGRGYLLGKRSDLEGLLGVGPLVDRLRDIFATAGQDPVVVAVPVTGQAGGYISPVEHSGTGPEATASGVAADNTDAVIQIVTGGALGTAEYKLSEDGGDTWGETTTTPANGQIAIGSSGVTVTLGSGDQVTGDLYEVTVRASIGPIVQTGSGPDVTATGTVKATAQVILLITKGGGPNEGTYQLTTDGGDNWSPERTIPLDGLIDVGTTGVTITIPESPVMALGTEYAFDLLAPVASISAVMTALEHPLETYDIEFVYVAGPSDSTDWAAMGAKADQLWNAHRPTFFLAEARLPYASESIDDWTAALITDRRGYAHRFVAVVAAYGEVSDVTGQRLVRNWGGLFAGRMMALPVMRAHGRVRDGGINQAALPVSYTEAHQDQLETNGFVTAKYYAGLNSAYWGDERTLAEDTSDFIYLTVVRTVFKAVRKARIAALKSLYDEAGDPMLGNNATGIAFLKANLGVALDTMVKAVPQELVDHRIDIQAGQDIVNNGLAVEITLIGVPIMRQIKLFANYVYAGGAFDPRWSEKRFTEA